jgi:hypothetical protein
MEITYKKEIFNGGLFVNKIISMDSTSFSDIVTPLYIIFKMDKDIEYEEFYQLISDYSLNITLGNIQYSLDYSFLLKLNPIKKIFPNLLVKLPLDIFIGIFFRNFNGYSNYIIKSGIPKNSQTSIIKEINIIHKINYDSSVKELFRHNYNKWFYQKKMNVKSIIPQNIIKVENKPNYEYIVSFDNKPNKYGFFLLYEDKLLNIQIIIGDTIKYIDKVQVISDGLLYVSFCEINYNDNKILSTEPVDLSKFIFSSWNPTIKIITNVNILKIYQYVSSIQLSIGGFNRKYSKQLLNNVYKIYHFNLGFANYDSINNTGCVKTKNPYELPCDKLFGKQLVEFNDIDWAIPPKHNDFSNVVGENDIICKFNNCSNIHLYSFFPQCKIIIIEKFNTVEYIYKNLSNIPIGVEELWLIPDIFGHFNWSKDDKLNKKINLDMLPCTIKKIFISDEYLEKSIGKIPFGTQILNLKKVNMPK